MKATNLTLGLALAIYFLVTFAIIYLFGSKVQTSFFKNLASNPNWENYMTRICFIIIIFCHVPYTFFAGKESFLVIVDEAHRRSISKALERKINE
jgi:F0F1-type ATP synthase membrane subunit a